MMVKVRKGFTLVELLIVIVIIGILAGGMMLASGAATATATATTIVSDLKALQGAAVMYYANHMDASSASISDLYEFMGDSQKIKNESTNYTFAIDSDGWWISYTSGRLKDNAVKAKVAAKAQDVGLYKTNSNVSTNLFTESDSEVFLKAR